MFSILLWLAVQSAATAHHTYWLVKSRTESTHFGTGSCRILAIHCNDLGTTYLTVSILPVNAPFVSSGNVASVSVSTRWPKLGRHAQELKIPKFPHSLGAPFLVAVCIQVH